MLVPARRGQMRQGCLTSSSTLSFNTAEAPLKGRGGPDRLNLVWADSLMMESAMVVYDSAPPSGKGRKESQNMADLAIQAVQRYLVMDRILTCRTSVARPWNVICLRATSQRALGRVRHQEKGHDGIPGRRRKENKGRGRGSAARRHHLLFWGVCPARSLFDRGRMDSSLSACRQTFINSRVPRPRLTWAS